MTGFNIRDEIDKDCITISWVHQKATAKVVAGDAEGGQSASRRRLRAVAFVLSESAVYKTKPEENERELGAMRLCVFSDIHGNLEALEAVLTHAGQMQADRYVCLGDIVGYGANPNECIARIRDLGDCPCLLGNHDAAVLGIPSNMGAAARQAIAWTRERLTTASFWFLKEMEDVVKWGDISFSHSNPYRPRNWYYVSEKTYISSSFARTSAKLLFLGHTHVPIAITRKNFFCIYLRSPEHRTSVPVAERNRQLFNCGSTGQPRDGDPRASYLIYDDVKRRVEFFRVEYDFLAAGEKIVMAGLPEAFGQRLATGV